MINELGIILLIIQIEKLRPREAWPGLMAIKELRPPNEFHDALSSVLFPEEIYQATSCPTSYLLRWPQYGMNKRN